MLRAVMEVSTGFECAETEGLVNMLLTQLCRLVPQSWRSFIVVSALSIISHVVVPDIQLPPLRSLLLRCTIGVGV
jgi:p-aminobenzoyl-glutamate transporter AbgT